MSTRSAQERWRSLVLLPWVVPGIVAATMWAWMFDTEFGIILSGTRPPPEHVAPIVV